jgi:hypothetical protein
MRPARGLSLLVAMAIAIGMVGVQPAVRSDGARVQAANTAQNAIAALALANMYHGPCTVTSKGGYFTAPDGTSSCPSGVPRMGWCAIFASWVWAKSGHVDYTYKLTYGPESFQRYRTPDRAVKGVKPWVGDVVIFSSYKPNPNGNAAHVGIVYSISGNTVYVIAGNDGPSPTGSVRYRTFDYTTLAQSEPTTPSPYWPYQYVTPYTH